MLFKIETKVVSPNRYHGTFRVKRICKDAPMVAMFSLNGADLAPSKAIFTSTITYSLGLGDVNAVSMGDGVSVSLAADIAVSLGDDSSVRAVPHMILNNVEAFNAEKNVSGVFMLPCSVKLSLIHSPDLLHSHQPREILNKNLMRLLITPMQRNK